MVTSQLEARLQPTRGDRGGTSPFAQNGCGSHPAHSPNLNIKETHGANQTRMLDQAIVHSLITFDAAKANDSRKTTQTLKPESENYKIILISRRGQVIPTTLKGASLAPDALWSARSQLWDEIEAQTGKKIQSASSDFRSSIAQVDVIQTLHTWMRIKCICM